MKKIILNILSVVLFVSALCSCGRNTSDNHTVPDVTITETPDIQSEPGDFIADIDPDDLSFSNKDLRTDYDTENATEIAFCDECSSFRIEAAGDYVVSGTCVNGNITVEATKQDKIHIILDNVSISSDSVPCLNVICADKVFVTLKEGTENYFTMTGESDTNGAVYSKDDITINGSGKLTVVSSQNGIVGKDELIITGGTYEINAQRHGLKGKDCVKVRDGYFTIKSGSDGIHAGNDTDTPGYIYIEGGQFTVDAAGDGMDAAGECIIAGGSVTVSRSYEGLEGHQVYILGGYISLTSSDDGINSCSSASSSGEIGRGGFGGGGFGGGFGGGDSESLISISGGKVIINAAGDGIDSNGNISISGGELYISGPTSSADGAIDYEYSAVITGGTVIACGASGMDETFSRDSTQGSIRLRVSGSSGKTVSVSDMSGNILASFTPEKNYSSVVISHPGIVVGKTYTVSVGSSDTKVEMTSLIYGGGNSGGPGGPGNPGGPGGPGDPGGPGGPGGHGGRRG